MEISEFKKATLALLTEPETADLPDDTWWERFGDLLDDVLAAKARAKREARQARVKAGELPDWARKPHRPLGL